ncbi:50S ribosomal protein L18 [Ureaplasma ceti]|uniref:Large ribosomal subunit protein uL18 n=1 Tax=Ureaplasma ceti TaxID=3119530 RepID=A0ABP9U9E0_9BACT
MKRINFDKKHQRLLRHKRTLNKFKAIDNGKPRLVITKTNAHINAQLIDDVQGKTLASSSSIQLNLANGNKENAAKVGKDIAEKILALNITEIAFDRGGSKYHGRVAALADAAREAGLKF